MICVLWVVVYTISMLQCSIYKMQIIKIFFNFFSLLLFFPPFCIYTPSFFCDFFLAISLWTNKCLVCIPNTLSLMPYKGDSWSQLPLQHLQEKQQTEIMLWFYFNYFCVIVVRNNFLLLWYTGVMSGSSEIRLGSDYYKMPVPKLGCKWDCMPKSIEQILCSCQAEGWGKRNRGTDKEER